MTSEEPVAVVGPDGTIMLPEEVRRRLHLEPGTQLRLAESKGMLQLHLPSVSTEDASSQTSQAGPPQPSSEELDDFWAAWWEQTQGPDDDLASETP